MTFFPDIINSEDWSSWGKEERLGRIKKKKYSKRAFFISKSN